MCFFIRWFCVVESCYFWRILRQLFSDFFSEFFDVCVCWVGLGVGVGVVREVFIRWDNHLASLYGWQVLLFKLNMTCKKRTSLRFVTISILKLTFWKINKCRNKKHSHQTWIEQQNWKIAKSPTCTRSIVDNRPQRKFSS